MKYNETVVNSLKQVSVNLMLRSLLHSERVEEIAYVSWTLKTAIASSWCSSDRLLFQLFAHLQGINIISFSDRYTVEYKHTNLCS